MIKWSTILHFSISIMLLIKQAKDLSLVVKILSWYIYIYVYIYIYQLGLTLCKAKQPLRGTELQERKHKADYRIHKICLERTCS